MTKNKGDTQDKLTRELREPAQQKAQLEKLQIERMQELSRHHSAILQATTDFVGIASVDGRLQYINPAGLEMCGFEEGTDVTKYRVQDFHPERTNKLLREEFFPICAKEGVWSGELKFLHQDGHEILTSAVILGHKLQNGELAYVSTISRNIIEHRGLEQALRESEEKFRKVTESAIEGIVLANQNGEIISWNKGAQTIFGYTEDEVLDKEIAFLMPQRYRDRHRNGLQRVTSTGKSSLLGKTLELVGERKDGTEFPLELSLTSWTTPQERVYNAIIRDVTERKQAEALFRESEEKFRLVTETIEDVFWLSTPEIDRILYVSPAYAQLWGRSVDDLYESPQSWVEAIHPEDRERILGAFKEFAQGRFDHEYRIVRPDGSVRWIRDRGYPARDENGNVRLMAGVARDITRQKRAEEVLQRTRDELEKRVKERAEELSKAHEKVRQHREELSHVSRVAIMAELSSSLAHELTQPLTAILTNAQTLARLRTGRKVDGEEENEILQDIIEDATRTGEMIKRQRDFLRRGELQKRPLDLNEVIHGVESLTRPDTLLSNVRLVLDLAPDLPEVIADRIQLEQVLMNLIRNGSDAMKDLAENLVVKTSMSASGTITVAVRDSGPPLKDKAFHQMFEPFYTTKPQGLGMGLSISRSIIEAHDGRLWATRNDKKGMTLRFTLPCSQGRSSE